MSHDRYYLERIFRWSLLVKGLDGVVELAGAGILFTTSSGALQAVIGRITAHELTEDPHDIIARAILALGGQLGTAHVFAGMYLLVHGIVKVTLVGFLLAENIRVYPWAIGALSAFTVYQGYLLWQQPTAVLLGLTVLDLLIVVLAVNEFTQLRAFARLRGSGPSQTA